MRIIRGFIVCLAAVCSVAMAQTYPDKSRPLKMVITNGAGTSIDILARAVAQGITEVSGLNVVVDNRPGGEGVIAIQSVRNSPHDGYTMLMTSASTQVFNVHLFSPLPYDPIKDLTPLAGIAKGALVMNVGPSTTVKTAREFIAQAKANPGKLTFGNGTTTTRLAGELVEREADVQLLSVPYKNLADAMLGLSAGQIDSVFIDVASASAFYKLGVRPLAVTSSSRMKALPDVPTLREEGVGNYELVGWFATYFASGVRPEQAAAMRDIIRKATHTRHVTQALEKFSMEPLELSGDELSTLTRSEIEKWAPMIKPAK